MPGFDGTGPRGQGAITGGGKGYCAAALNSVGFRQGNGRGSYGRGGGRGFRNCLNATGLTGWMRAQRGMRAYGVFNPALTKEDELVMLKRQVDFCREELDATQARVQDLEGKQAGVK